MKKLRICVIGCGAFSHNFVPLFKAHPNVEKVWVCDIIRERADKYSAEFGVEIIDSFEDALARSDVNSIAIFTERHLHGPMVIKSLKAGKHVYSAVPMASTPEECAEIVELVKKTGLTYMMGETCIYYPCSMFCRREFAKGTFGKFVYAEAQYFHNITHFSVPFRANPASSSLPPFFYPTHSTSMVLHALGDHVVKVTGMGYRDDEDDGYWNRGDNVWGNPYSCEFSLMQLSRGGVARISECRRIGYKAPSSFISGFYGTNASYQFNNAQHLVTHLTSRGVELEDVSAQVNPVSLEDARDTSVEFKNDVANHKYQWRDMAPVQADDFARLPESFADPSIPNGHMASHQLLIDDFCTAAYNDTLPTVNAWLAARYTIPGLIAHESIMRGSIPLDVPDCGDAPAGR